MVRMINEAGEILVDSKLQNYAEMMAKLALDLLFSFFSGSIGSILVFIFKIKLRSPKESMHSTKIQRKKTKKHISTNSSPSINSYEKSLEEVSSELVYFL
jgi:hypothetical protein